MCAGIARRELKSDRAAGEFRQQREGRGAGREGVAVRVVASREGQQSRAVQDRGNGGWLVEERAESGGRWRRVEAGVVSRLRPPSGERLLANYL